MAHKARALIRTSAAVLIALFLAQAIRTSPLEANPSAPPVPPPQTPSPDQPGPPDVPADWWAAIQAGIREAEYSVTWQDQTYLPDLPAAYQAPNRRQGLRTYFADGGPVVIPRIWPDGASEPPWRWDLRLEGWGREGDMRAVETAAPDARDNRVEYRRAALMEWYRNDPEGLALGLRVEAAPEGDAAAGLRLALAWSGDLAVEEGESGAAFLGPDGVVLRLGAPAVCDAAGRLLDARLAVEGNRLELRVDDASALYPIEAVMTLTSPLGVAGLPPDPTWILPWTSANTSYGFSVATAGDVNNDGSSDFIVGAERYDGGQTDEGRALIYLGHPSGAPTSYWSKEGDQTGARFGYSVGTAGDVNGDGYADVVVGAPYYDHPEVDEGGAWIYEGSISGVHSAPDFFAQSDQAGANLGVSVAFAGDVNGDGFSDVIVGARWYNAPTTGEGVALVWHGSADGLNGGANGTPDNADWRAESNETSASLGSSVATAGDVDADGYADVIVGAFQYGATDAGAAWVWHGSAYGVNGGDPGTPSNAAWVAVGASDAAHLGLSVSTAGDVNGDGYADVIVGAPHTTQGSVEEGAAYVYLGSAAGLEDSWDNADEGNAPHAWFGMSVALAGDVNGDGYADVVVGAPLYTNDLTEEGRAFLWYGSADGISDTRDWWAEGDVAGGWFGNSVATAGDLNADGYSDLIVGAPGDSTGAGRVYIYYGSPDLPSETANWVKRSNQEGAYFGWSVGAAGDVNADGYADIIVGAPQWDDGQANEGGAWIYRGAAGGLVSAPYWYKQSDHAGAQFGWSVAAAGDVNGDGYSDVIVGAPTYANGQTDEGGAWVYLGSSTGVSTTPSWAKASDQTEAQFGYSVAAAGDVNGDGYADVIVGAPYMEYGEKDEGIAWLYLGSSGGLRTTPSRHIQSDQVEALLGYSVASAGDVNADGLSDVLIGAPNWEDNVISEGRAWLYLGSARGLASSAAWHAESNNFNARMGHAVAGAGDVNGDGFADVIVGAPYYGDGGLTSEGKVWLFHGSAGGLSSSAAWSREAGQNDAYYGYSVSTAGDVNGDGYADVLIGAPSMTGSGEADEGVARLYLGGSTGLGASYAWTGEGDQVASWYGMSVGTAGDVNGDGYADLVVGAKDYNDTYVNEGRTLVYYGNGRSGTALALRQYKDSGVPLALLGATDSNAFRPAYTRRSPFGRGDMATEIEVKCLGVAFTGRDYRWEGYWTDAVPGSEVSAYSRDLDWGTAYHWRLRIRYRPVTTPWMSRSRWVTMPWNGWNEEDFRTVGTRVYLPMVLANR